MGARQSGLTDASVDQTYARLFELSAARAPPSRPRSPFTRLAKIEVQLILQWLDRTSLLRAARCDRWLLRVADTPLAWAHCALRFGVWQRWSDHALSTRLLAHSPQITLEWRSEDPRLQAASLRSCTALSSLERVLGLWPRLSALDLSACRWSKASEWNRALAHPTVRSVQTLRLCDADRASRVSPLSPESFRLIGALPRLSALAFDYFPAHAAQARALIQSMQARLMSVQVRQTAESAVLSAIVQCASLTYLHLIEPRWGGLDFRSCFLSSSVLLNLERLDLDRWFGPTGAWMTNADPVSVDDFSAVLAAMTRLTHLGLHDVNGSALIFPCLVHAPALRLLSLTSRSEGQVQMFRQLCPVAPVLSLLRDQPRLRVAVTLCSNKEPIYVGCHPDSEEFMNLSSEWRRAAEQDSFGGRLTLARK